MIKHPVIQTVVWLSALSLLVAGCGSQSSTSNTSSTANASATREARLRERLATLRQAYQEKVAVGERLARIRAQFLAKSVFTVPKNSTFLGPSLLVDTESGSDEFVAELAIERSYLREDRVSQPSPKQGPRNELDEALESLEVDRLRAEVTADDLTRSKPYLEAEDSPLAAEVRLEGIIHLRPPRAFGKISVPGGLLETAPGVLEHIKSVIVIKSVHFERATYTKYTKFDAGSVPSGESQEDFADQLECFVFSWPEGELLAAYRTDRVGVPTAIPVPADEPDPYKLAIKWLNAHCTNADFSMLPSHYLQPQGFTRDRVFGSTLKPAVGHSGSFTADLFETVEAGKVSCSIAHENGRYTKFVVSAFGEETRLTDAQLAQLAGYSVGSLTVAVLEEGSEKSGPRGKRVRQQVRFRLEKQWPKNKEEPDFSGKEIECRAGRPLAITDTERAEY
jgi:hypothetical protein